MVFSMHKFARMLLAAFMLPLLCVAAEKYQKSGPVELTKDGRRWVEHTLKNLSLEEKVGQMLNIRYFTNFQNFDSDEYRQFRDQIQKYHIGSVVLTVHVD